MKIIIPLMFIWVGCFGPNLIAQIPFDIKKIEKKVEKKFNYKVVKNRSRKKLENEVTWIADSNELYLFIQDFQTTEIAQEKLLQERWALSNAQRQEKLESVYEGYVFGNFEDKGGTIIIRQENLLICFKSNDLTSVPAVADVVLKILDKK